MSASTTTTFDLAIIGGGPGGYPAALRGARLGLRTVLVEAEGRLGGVCLHCGCIPTKALLRQAEVLRLARRAHEFGLRLPGEPGWNWEAVIERSRSLAAVLASGIDHLMARHGVEVVHGWGRLTPARAVVVDPAGSTGGKGRALEARHVLLATGGRPCSLPGVDIDGQRVIDSHQALRLPRRPASLVIVGGGAVGVEFASFFAAYGTRVTLLEAQKQVLPGHDGEAAAVLAAALADQGVTVHTGARVTAVDTGPRRRTATVGFETAAGSDRVRAERVLMAVGVIGNTQDLGLEAAGVRVEAGHVVVDAHHATTAPGVWAVGDLVGAPQLAHAATAAGVAAVEAMAKRPRRAVGPIPACIYTEPQVASVGLTEAAARARGVEVKVGRFPWTASGRARAGGATQGFVKLVFGARYGDLLGGVIVGPEATELIGEVGLALALESTWEELARTVHAHPTLSEGIAEAAAAAFGEAIHI